MFALPADLLNCGELFVQWGAIGGSLSLTFYFFYQLHSALNDFRGRHPGLLNRLTLKEASWIALIMELFVIAIPFNSEMTIVSFVMGYAGWFGVWFFSRLFICLVLDAVRYFRQTKIFNPLYMLPLYGIIESFALIYTAGGLRTSGPTPTYDPLVALYFSIVTFTTLGYGDITPTEAMRAVAGLEAITGYVVLGALASMIFLLIQDELNNNVALGDHDPPDNHVETRSRVEGK